MKHIVALASILFCAVFVAGCADAKTFNNNRYEPYGIFNEEARKSPDVIYEVSAGSVIVAIIFCETIVVPIYVVGWDLWEPVGPKPAPR